MRTTMAFLGSSEFERIQMGVAVHERQQIDDNTQRKAFWSFFCYIKPSNKHSIGCLGR